jgi:hypothetical protein
MDISKYLRRCLLVALAAGSATPFALAADVAASAGAIVGVVTNSAKGAVAHATVTARKSDGSAIRATLSAGDGLYAFSDLPPGTWLITAHVDGAPDATASVTVAANAAARSDLLLAVAPSSTPAPASAAAAVAATLPTVPEGLQAPDPGPAVDNDTPFAFADFSWLNATPRNKQPAFDTKFFTPDVRFDINYMYDEQHPVDHTIVGSTESFRSGEFQIEQISFGGDFHWDNVKARLLTMYGLFATTTPRNDGSSGNIGGVGQWDLQDAYKYVSEANAGYHFDVQHGLNVDAGIFVSYIGLFSYYNYDNWTYQPSYVSSNTPWFFNGLRVQWFPTNTLKIEPWLINGWQSYARFNSHPGFGGQILWQPTGSFKLVLNSYMIGQDNLQNFPAGEIVNGVPVNFAKTQRIHEDDSIEVKYYDNHENGNGLSKAAFSLTWDAGCQFGGGVTCTSGVNKSNFLGAMAYDRLWFHHDLYAITVGGGFMNNPGRYLTLLPPVNGASASSGTPYFTELPGQGAFMWDSTLNFQYMPKDWITWWSELGYRHSSIPYFSGVGGVTPAFGNNGSPASYTCNSGATAGTNVLSQANAVCGGGNGGVWYPDLRHEEMKISAGLMVKF